MRELLLVFNAKETSFLASSFDIRPRSLLKNLSSLIIFSGVAIGVFLLSRSVTSYLIMQAHIGQFLYHRFLSMLLYVFFITVNLGNMIVCYATLYRSDEVNFLMGLPVHHEKIFLIKFVDKFFYSSSTLTLLGLSWLLGYGAFFHMPWPLDKDEKEVRLTNRILLNPFTAKRLLILLEKTVQKHELKYGPLEAESLSSMDLLKAGLGPGMEEIKRRANFLIQLIKELNVIYDFERSFKMSQQKMGWHRFLMVVDKNDIGGDAHERVLNVCDRMGMPEDFLGMFKENFSQANPVDFGFEADEGRCIYKTYLDFLPQLRKGGHINLNQTKPHIMFLGFKWDVLDPAKMALTQYTWSPALSFEEIRRRLSDIYENDKGRKSIELAEEFLRIISSRTTYDKVYYLVQCVSEPIPGCSLPVLHPGSAGPNNGLEHALKPDYWHCRNVG